MSAPRGPLRLRLWIAAGALGLQATLLALSCGGTTGREGLSDPGDASGDQTLPRKDATIDVLTGAFDVKISYADRKLPDVKAPSDGGSHEASYDWPSCPPFAPVGADGVVTTLGMEINQAPTIATDGGVALAPDGSVCGSFGWLGSPQVDNCVTSQGAATPDYIQLPPCNWCADAGTAIGGSRAGQARLDICLDLYECIRTSHCGVAGIQTCLCGPDLATCSMDASGPCLAQELAALEYDESDIVQAIKNYTDAVDTTGVGLASFSGHCGGALNQVYQVGTSFGCLDAGAGD